jgi:pSer/pThr/pTyr-binding forkhead associated (FHA) protein
LCLTRVSRDQNSGARTPIDTELVIGKTNECDINLTDDDFASRIHASVKVQDGTVVVEDLDSSNGTCVRLRRSFILEPDDELIVGHTTFRLEHIPTGQA